MLERHVRPRVEEALQDTRVVAVLGARQVGKSTLVKTVADEYLGARVVTFDDQVTRAAAQDDPTGFAMGLDLPVVIDEVQRVPDVLLAIKQRVDQDPSPGQFLLTGSANILTAPRSTPDVFRGRRSPHRSRSVAQQVVSPRAFASIEVCASPGQTEAAPEVIFDLDCVYERSGADPSDTAAERAEPGITRAPQPDQPAAHQPHRRRRCLSQRRHPGAAAASDGRALGAGRRARAACQRVHDGAAGRRRELEAGRALRRSRRALGAPDQRAAGAASVTDSADRPDGSRVPRLRAVDLLRTLFRHGVEFVIIGGFSLAAHSAARATKDLDIVPEPSRANLAQLMAALAEREADHLDIGDFDRGELVELNLENRVEGQGNWALRTRFGRLDVMQYVEGVRGYEQLRDGAVIPEIELLDEAVMFAGLDDLVAMKAAAGRDQDLLDIDTLLRSR